MGRKAGPLNKRLKNEKLKNSNGIKQLQLNSLIPQENCRAEIGHCSFATHFQLVHFVSQYRPHDNTLAWGAVSLKFILCKFYVLEKTKGTYA